MGKIKNTANNAKEKAPGALRGIRKATGVAYESVKRVSPKIGSAAKKAASAAVDVGKATKTFFTDNKDTFDNVGKKAGSFFVNSIRNGAEYVQKVVDKWQ